MSDAITDAAPSPDIVAAADVTTVHTGDPSGVPAEQAFAGRIEQVKFSLREHDADDALRLIDDLYVGVVRLEGAMAGRG